MPLIATTVFSNGKIEGQIVYCTDEEFKRNTMLGSPDITNESTVSVTFTKEYLKKKGINEDELIDKMSKNAQITKNMEWVYAYTITIPAIKVILHEAELDFHLFIDAYAEYLKSL